MCTEKNESLTLIYYVRVVWLVRITELVNYGVKYSETILWVPSQELVQIFIILVL